MRPWERSFRTELQKALPRSPRSWVQWVCFTDQQAEAQTRGCIADSPGESGLISKGNELHIVGRKHAKVAIWPIATPPAFVNHLNAGDEVLRVKGDLGLVGCKEGEPRCCAESSGTLATSLS